jgi:hypothetical protein
MIDPTCRFSMRRLPVVNALPVPRRHPAPLRLITRSCARVRLTFVCFRRHQRQRPRGPVSALVVQGGPSAARDAPPPAQAEPAGSAVGGTLTLLPCRLRVMFDGSRLSAPGQLHLRSRAISCRRNRRKGQFRTAVQRRQAQRRPFLRTLNCISLATTKAINGTTLWSRDFQDRVGRSYGSQV